MTFNSRVLDEDDVEYIPTGISYLQVLALFE